MGGRKRDLEYRVSPNISSVTGLGDQSRRVKRAPGKRERLESMLQNGRRRERFLGSSEETFIRQMCAETYSAPFRGLGLGIRGEQDGHRSLAPRKTNLLANGVRIVFVKASVPYRVSTGGDTQAISLRE